MGLVYGVLFMPGPSQDGILQNSLDSAEQRGYQSRNLQKL